MNLNKELSRAIDLKNDLIYSLKNNEEPVIQERDIETLKWVIEQAKKTDIYQSTLVRIAETKESSSSFYAKSALWEVEQRFK